MNFKKENLCLYAVTDRAWIQGTTLAAQVKEALAGGITMLQLREKSLSREEFRREALEIKALCHDYGVPFLINDDVDLAREVDADGVHVGQGDMPVSRARQLLGPEKIIGVSARTVEQAKAAEAAGADYLGVGAVFATGTKADAMPLSREMLRAITTSVSLPVVAIGGITRDNLMSLRGSGVAGVALVSAIFGQPSVEEAARSLRERTERMTAPVLRGAIFDLDGTLLDSMPWWMSLGERYVQRFGQEPEPGLGEKLFGATLPEGARYLQETYGIDREIPQILADFQEMMAYSYEREIPLKPGVEGLLRRLKKRGIRLTVATLTEEPLVKKALSRYGLLDDFEEIFTATKVGIGKSSPRIYQAAAQRMGCLPEETLVFEDSLDALRVAKAAGFYAVGIFDHASAHKADALQEEARLYGRNWESLSASVLPQLGHRTALSIAGSDCSGGAGIQADLKTMLANGVYGMSVITALTAQNTTGVFGVQESTPAFLAQQLDAVFTDIWPDAVKIGMVSSTDLIRVIARALRRYGARGVVVDPVMVSTSGSALMQPEAILTLKEELFPLADLLTPNIPEAEILSGMSIADTRDMEAAAKAIAEDYGCAVLLKGGHSVQDANDLLYLPGKENPSRWFCGQRIDNPNTHGTGCTLSSAIAANLAWGFDLEEAVGRAKEYLTCALAEMLNLGRGSGPVDHGVFVQTR